jgi:hypothetical protein
VDDAQSRQGERQHPLGVDAVSEESGEEFMHLLFVDGLSTRFSGNINDPTAQTTWTDTPFQTCLLYEGMPQLPPWSPPQSRAGNAGPRRLVPHRCAHERQWAHVSYPTV